MVPRGLILLGLMLVLVTAVGLVMFRPPPAPPDVQDSLAKMEPSKPGWEVRYNAVMALARRGSTKLPIDVLAEVLDEKQQMRNFMGKTPEDEVVVDEQAARVTVLSGLKALEKWVANKDAVKAVQTENAKGYEQLRAAVDKLTQSPSPVLRQRAEAVKQLMGA